MTVTATKLDPCLTEFAYKKALTINKSDTDELASVARAIMVDVAGTVAVILDGDTASVTLDLLAKTMYHNLLIKQVKSTGTTATGIHVFW